MKTLPRDDLARLLLRVVLALLMLLHGLSKLRHGAGPILDMVASHGLPAALGNLVYVGEIVAPLMVLLGVWTRAGALVIAINMVVAILLVHTGQLLELNKQGGWALELQALYLAGALAIALLGAGRYSAGGAPGKWN
ncbi:MAG: DoxX family protein [Pseudomonadota bacterium]